MAAGRGHVLIMDEVDGMDGNADRGGISVSLGKGGLDSLKSESTHNLHMQNFWICETILSLLEQTVTSF